MSASTMAPLPSRTGVRRRTLVLGGAMAAAATIGEWATPRRLMAQESPLPGLSAMLPFQVGDWRGQDASRLQLVSPDVQAVMNALYQQTLARLYRHPRWGTVMLAVAYGGDQSDATRVHRPEVCYPAQGFTVGPTHQDALMLGRSVAAPGMPAVQQGPQPVVLPVRRLLARMGSRHEPITYWITVGQQVATRAVEQKLIQIQYGLHGIVPDGMLMRVSSLERDLQQAWWVHHRFIEALFMAVAPVHRTRVFGGAVKGANQWR